jgi:hypothetical protein
MSESERDGLRRAARTAGAAEGSALRYSAVAARRGDPTTVVAEFERTAYDGSGLGARPDGLGDVYWSLWLVQRLRVRLTESRAQRGAVAGLESGTAFVDGLHAALSAVAHDAMGDGDSAAACLERAAAAAATAAREPNPVPESGASEVRR